MELIIQAVKLDSGIPIIPFCRRTYILLLFCTLHIAVGAQRLDIGFSYDFVGFCPTRFSNPVFFSETSYKAYYIKKLQCPWGMQDNISLSLAIDYNRFFVTGGFGLNSYLINGIKYKYQYPVGNDGFKTYYSRISCAQTEIEGSFGFILASRSLMRPYIETGLGRLFNPNYREDISDKKTFSSFWSNRTELRNYAELDKPFNYLLLGYGYRGDLFSVYARYKIRLGHHEVFYSNLSIGMSMYARFSKLRKHYIYQPEE
jgi:hypothetical protein